MLETLFKRSNTEVQQEQEPIKQPPIEINSSNAGALENFEVLFNYLKGNHGTFTATSSNAMRFSTVFSCVNILGDDIAKLPWKTYKKNKDGDISYDTTSDVYRILSVRPNRYMTPFVFKKLAETHVALKGNHYSYIKFDSTGKVLELLPLNVDQTRPIINQEDGELYYQTVINGKQVFLFDYEVFHLKGITMDGINGISPITACSIQLETIDSALKVNKEIIDGGNTPLGVLKAPTKIDPDKKNIVRDAWKRANSGHNVAIIDMGWEYQKVGISPSDMQYLESMKFNQQQISSIFKVPLHKINDLTHATYTNIESQSLDYVKNTLQPIVTMFEEEALLKLYSKEQREQGYYCKFNMDSELRGSAIERAKVQEINIRNGIKTLNEVRGQNEDSPYQGDFADKPWMSLNNVPAENAEEHQKNKFGLSLHKGNQEEDAPMKGGEKDE